jgi:alpha-ketoglutarate-dependent taurine dioxygenase
MSHIQSNKPEIIRHEGMPTSHTSQDGLVRIEPLALCEGFYPENALPLLMRPATGEVDLITWATNNRELLEKYLLKHGGILFRDFLLRGTGFSTAIEGFKRFITGVSGEPLEYSEPTSPRSQVSGNIYTSTDYPAHQSIFLHNETSYRQNWPLHIFFFCQQPAQQGGETPLADTRKIYERIDPTIRDRFRQKQVLYVRNFGDGMGLPWQTVFQTTEKEVVEQYCRKSGIAWEWKSGNRLRTRTVRPAIVSHPTSGEMLWFNHMTFWHVTTLEPKLRNALLAVYEEADLPNNAYYGDGTPIEHAVLDELRQAYKEETRVFPWQQEDILMLDNMLTAHGRRPFVGPRQVLTGMSRLTHHT